MHELHRGHESMHAEMILILFVTLIVSQIALVKWRQVYPHAYHVSSTFTINLKSNFSSAFRLTLAQPLVDL
jgi:RING finger protein 121